jgi:hypothetical protein
MSCTLFTRQVCAFAALSLLSFASYGQSHQVTQSLYDGFVVSTGNVVAPVEVRAKSLGPGLCAVEITGGAQTVRLDAPPLAWSGWTTLYNSIGESEQSINVSSLCDTGAVFEVRYYPK